MASLLPGPFRRDTFLRTTGIALLILLVVLSIVGLYGRPLSQSTDVSLSRVVEEISAGNVTKIIVEGEELTVALKNSDTALVAQKESGTSVTETFTNLGVTEERLQGIELAVEKPSGFGFWVSALLPVLLPFVLLGAFLWFMMRSAQTASNRAMSFGTMTARAVDPADAKKRTTFKDVAGNEEAKNELEEVVEFLKTPKKFLKLGARIPKGVLLVGPPGTGKTLIARAVAGEAGVPFFSISGSDFVEMFVGVGASRVRDLFRKVKNHSPAILFIDELDAVGRQRGAGLGGGHDEREQTLNQILVEMDGFEQNENAIVLAASVTGETPVLVKDPVTGEVSLRSIGEVIDAHYASDEEGVEKPTNLEVLGFQRRPDKLHHRLLFGHSRFVPVRSVFRHRVHEIYEIDHLGGMVRATGNHSVFVRTRKGLETKAVSELRAGDVLADIPYKVSRTNQLQRAIRAHAFADDWALRLPVYQENERVREGYSRAVASHGLVSQSQIAQEIGVAQTTVSKWQRTRRLPRSISRAYFKHKLPEEVEVTPEVCRLLGYYTAEGYARKEVTFTFNAAEEEYLADVEQLVREIFGLSPDKVRTIDETTHLIYYSRPLAGWFIGLVGKGAARKHVPAFLFEAPYAYFLEFFRGYARGDGHVDKRGRLEITSVSPRLIKELNWLCRMHGLKSFVHQFTAKAGRRIADGKPLAAVSAYRLGLGKRSNPFSPEFSPLRSAGRLARVRTVRKVPFNGYVYDFCGCENEAFFGGDTPLLLHNTNRPDVLDPALLRPGRFDRQVVVELPDIREREAILHIHVAKVPLDGDVELRRVAERTPGFSGADLSNLINEAAILAARSDRSAVTQRDVLNSIEKVLLGPEKRSKVFSVKEKEVTAYHEAGHAVVAYYMPHTDPVRKISIISRGHAGGYTLKLPDEDKRLHTKTEFLGELATLMGGYVAERVKFSELTTGASNDLKKATNLARRIVTEWGMSELGPVTFGQKDEYVFLGKELHEARNYSESTAAKIDEQISKLLATAQRQAEEILTKYRDKFDVVAKTLIERETLEQADFDRLMKGESLDDSAAGPAGTSGASTERTAGRGASPLPGQQPGPAPAPA